MARPSPAVSPAPQGHDRLSAGQRVFVLHQSEGWVLAAVDTVNASLGTVSVSIAPPDGGPPTAGQHQHLPAKDVLVPSAAAAAALGVAPGTPDTDGAVGATAAGPGDLLRLPELHHATLLHALRQRHARDECYTSLGELLVALNPFRYTIPHYQPSAIDGYLAHYGRADIPATSQRPHPWATAHRVYHNLRQRRRNQTLVISGESGSGKTETCKTVLHYLCCLSDVALGVRAHLASTTAASAPPPAAAPAPAEGHPAPPTASSKVRDLVEQSNPILEAFGNAKTVRNDNSSRFGKLMEVHFDDRGALVGMTTTVYLLEKSRVVACGQDERLFHAFYLLAQGAPAELRDRLRLRGGARAFPFLCQGGTTALKAVDEAAEFQHVVDAFRAVGLAAAEVDFVWGVVAAVMHLQRVAFAAALPSAAAARARFSGQSASADGPASLAGPEDEQLATFVAGLLGLAPAVFAKALVSVTNVVRGEDVVKQLTKQKAEEQRDSLCKHLYTHLFLWIVQRINAATAPDPTQPPPSGFVALLDIFGFEDFHTNSLEQLCINLANETLQRHYAKHVFERDREEVTAEGVAADAVSFRDNQPCIDLVAGPRASVFSMLDDASTLDQERSSVDPNRSLLDRLTAKHRPDYQTGAKKGSKSVLDRAEAMRAPSDFFHRSRLDDAAFVVRHYAADVRYTVTGFVEKNTDTLKEAQRALLAASTAPLLAEMLCVDGGPGSPAGLLSPRTPVEAHRASSPRPSTAGGRKAASVVADFSRSLQELLQTVDDTQPSWIRCVRPHPKKVPKLFDGRAVLEQLVATGVLETVRQRRRNFPFRIPTDAFLQRYACVAPGIRRLPRSCGVHERVAAVLQVALGHERRQARADPALSQGDAVKADDAQCGRARVFLRPAAMAALDACRRDVLDRHVSVLVGFATVRRSRGEVALRRWTAAAVNTQRVYRTTALIRRCVRGYYAELWARIDADHTAQRAAVVEEESARRRADLTGAEKAAWLAIHRPFLAALGPMVATVLGNIQRVETKTRAAIADSVAAARTELAALATAAAEAAVVATAARLEVERRWATEVAAELLLVVREGRVGIEQEEAAARAAVARQLAPAEAEVRAMWRRRQQHIAQRDAYVRRLEAEAEAERHRLRLQEARRVEQERGLWRSYVGPDGVHRDHAFLQRGGLPAAAAAQQLDQYYACGVPSQLLRPAAARPSARPSARPCAADTDDSGSDGEDWGAGRRAAVAATARAVLEGHPLPARRSAPTARPISGRPVSGVQQAALAALARGDECRQRWGHAAVNASGQPGGGPDLQGVTSYEEYGRRWHEAFVEQAHPDPQPGPLPEDRVVCRRL